MSQSLFLGLDGGSYKTLGVLIDQDGAVLACGRAGPSSSGAAPSPEAAATLAELVERLCAEAGVAREGLAHVGLGLSGIDFADEFAGQHAALSACLGIDPPRLTLVNDGVAALWGASAAEHAAIVHHGSGVTHAYRAGFGTEQPYDHLDVGALFDIRYALAALVARMIDGRAPATPLKETVLAHYGIADEADYAEALYRRQIPRELHRTAQVHAFAAWLAGDPEATRLVESAAADYALTAVALVRRTGDPRAEVAFGGGVINHAPEEFHALLVERVRELSPEAVVVRPRLSPGHGAALMAAFHHGLDPAPLWARMVQDSPLQG